MFPGLSTPEGVGVHLTDFQFWGLRKGLKSSVVPARKPSRRPGRYCILLSRVFTSAVSWAMSRLARLARDLFSTDQTDSTGFSSGAYGGSRKTASQSRATTRPVIARLRWVFRPSHNTTSGPPSCWCASSSSRA